MRPPCASILAYLSTQYRVLSLVHQSMPSDPPPRRKGQPEPATPRRPVALVAENEPMMAGLLGLAAVAAGVAAWSILSWYEAGLRPAPFGASIARLRGPCSFSGSSPPSGF